MSKDIQIEDITLRDGAQCLWATRLSTEEIVPIASTINRAGFQIVDLLGGAAIDTSIIYLREDPFERARVLHELMPNTLLNFNCRGQSVFRWTQYPDDVADLTIRTLARNGIGSIMLFDPLNDMRNLAFSARVARDCGLYIIASVFYAVSPYHTDEVYLENVRDAVEMGVDAISIKDPQGFLIPERATSLIEKVRPLLKGQVLQLHSHTSIYEPGAVHLAAMDMGDEGPDVYHGAIPPLTWQGSHPSHRFLVENLRSRGYNVNVDLDAIDDASAYLHYVAERRGLPIGRPVPQVNDGQIEHQVPGGMMSNLRRQLAEQGQAHRLGEVLAEVTRVRKDLGYPLVVSPMAQYLGITALMNVLSGERYSVVPNEIRSYLLGYYGRPPGPVDPNVRDKIIGNDEPITGRPGDYLPPMVEKFKRENGPFDSDEQLVLAIFYSSQILKNWNLKDWDGYRSTPKTPSHFLVERILSNTRVASFKYEKTASDYRFELSRSV